MNTLLKFIPWIVVVVLAIAGVSVLTQYLKQLGVSDQLETYNRQLSGQLTEKEALLQAFNSDLGLAQSELMTQQELNAKLALDKKLVDEKFEAFKKEHGLQIASLDTTIASLRQQIQGGNSTTIVSGCDSIENCKIAYSWADPLIRFSLVDPNIFEKNNEIFTSNQMFKVTGEIYSQVDGQLQTHRLTLNEVYKDKNGNYQVIEGVKAEIVSSEFSYINPPKIQLEWKWTDLFSLRPIIVGSVVMFPNIGNTEIGLGMEIINVSQVGIGLNSHTSFNFSDPKLIGQYIGVTWSPTFFPKPLNLGIGVSVGSPFFSFGQQWCFKIDLIFYIY